MSSAGATLRLMREQKPLVHQITNYVVMNETCGVRKFDRMREDGGFAGRTDL